MVIDLKGYRVFIATPRGLEQERNAFKDVLTEYNNSDAMLRGVTFLPVGWEATLGGVGRPQTLINKDLKECDYFVLILWDRWGSPSGGEPGRVYTSGTEEEYEVAMECLKDLQFCMRQLVVFFKAVDERKLSDPGEQLKKVLDFKERLEKEKSILFHTYDTVTVFESKLRAHLAQWVREHETGLPSKTTEANMSARYETDSDKAQPTPPDTLPAPSGSLDESVSELVQLARNLAFEGRLTEAETLFAKAVIGNDLYALYCYGDFLRRLGRLTQAATKYDRVIALADAARDIGWKARALNRLGDIHKASNDLNQAEAAHKQSLELFRQLGDEEGLASVYTDLGDLYQARSELDQSENMYQQSLRIKKQIGSKEGMADLYSNLGNLYQVRNNLDRAEEMHQQSLEIKEQLGINEGLADVYSNLGSLHQARGDFNKAQTMYRQSLEMFQHLGDLQNTADVLSNLGNLYRETGDLEQAETMFQQSLKTFEQTGNLQGMADAYINLGYIHYARGEWDTAETIYRQSLELFEQLEDKPGMANVYNRLGDVYKSRGDSVKADQMYKKTLEILEHQH